MAAQEGVTTSHPKEKERGGWLGFLLVEMMLMVVLYNVGDGVIGEDGKRGGDGS